MKNNKKKVLFIVPTEEYGASSRYRVYQFLKYVNGEFEYKVEPFMTNEMYINWKKGNTKKIIIPFFKSILKRIKVEMLYHLVICFLKK